MKFKRLYRSLTITLISLMIVLLNVQSLFAIEKENNVYQNENGDLIILTDPFLFDSSIYLVNDVEKIYVGYYYDVIQDEEIRDDYGIIKNSDLRELGICNGSTYNLVAEDWEYYEGQDYDPVISNNPITFTNVCDSLGVVETQFDNDGNLVFSTLIGSFPKNNTNRTIRIDYYAVDKSFNGYFYIANYYYRNQNKEIVVSKDDLITGKLPNGLINFSLCIPDYGRANARTDVTGCCEPAPDFSVKLLEDGLHFYGPVDYLSNAFDNGNFKINNVYIGVEYGPGYFEYDVINNNELVIYSELLINNIVKGENRFSFFNVYGYLDSQEYRCEITNGKISPGYITVNENETGDLIVELFDKGFYHKVKNEGIISLTDEYCLVDNGELLFSEDEYYGYITIPHSLLESLYISNGWLDLHINCENYLEANTSTYCYYQLENVDGYVESDVSGLNIYSYAETSDWLELITSSEAAIYISNDVNSVKIEDIHVQYNGDFDFISYDEIKEYLINGTNKITILVDGYGRFCYEFYYYGFDYEILLSLDADGNLIVKTNDDDFNQELIYGYYNIFLNIEATEGDGTVTYVGNVHYDYDNHCVYFTRQTLKNKVVVGDNYVHVYIDGADVYTEIITFDYGLLPVPELIVQTDKDDNIIIHSESDDYLNAFAASGRIVISTFDSFLLSEEDFSVDRINKNIIIHRSVAVKYGICSAPDSFMIFIEDVDGYIDALLSGYFNIKLLVPSNGVFISESDGTIFINCEDTDFLKGFVTPDNYGVCSVYLTNLENGEKTRFSKDSDNDLYIIYKDGSVQVDISDLGDDGFTSGLYRIDLVSHGYEVLDNYVIEINSLPKQAPYFDFWCYEDKIELYSEDSDYLGALLNEESSYIIFSDGENEYLLTQEILSKNFNFEENSIPIEFLKQNLFGEKSYLVTIHVADYVDLHLDTYLSGLNKAGYDLMMEEASDHNSCIIHLPHEFAEIVKNNLANAYLMFENDYYMRPYDLTSDMFDGDNIIITKDVFKKNKMYLENVVASIKVDGYENSYTNKCSLSFGFKLVQYLNVTQNSNGDLIITGDEEFLSSVASEGEVHILSHSFSILTSEDMKFEKGQLIISKDTLIRELVINGYTYIELIHDDYCEKQMETVLENCCQLFNCYSSLDSNGDIEIQIDEEIMEEFKNNPGNNLRVNYHDGEYVTIYPNNPALKYTENTITVSADTLIELGFGKEIDIFINIYGYVSPSTVHIDLRKTGIISSGVKISQIGSDVVLSGDNSFIKAVNHISFYYKTLTEENMITFTADDIKYKNKQYTLNEIKNIISNKDVIYYELTFYAPGYNPFVYTACNDEKVSFTIDEENNIVVTFNSNFEELRNKDFTVAVYYSKYGGIIGSRVLAYLDGRQIMDSLDGNTFIISRESLGLMYTGNYYIYISSYTSSYTIAKNYLEINCPHHLLEDDILGEDVDLSYIEISVKDVSADVLELVDDYQDLSKLYVIKYADASIVCPHCGKDMIVPVYWFDKYDIDCEMGVATRRAIYITVINGEARVIADDEIEMQLPDGHDYEVEFVWDGFNCFAHLTCKNNPYHVQDVKLEVTSLVTTTPTCTREGERTYTAQYGDQITTKVERIDKVQHQLVHYDYQDSTFENTGVKEHYECKECHGYFLDKEGKQEVSSKDITIAVKKVPTKLAAPKFKLSQEDLAIKISITEVEYANKYEIYRSTSKSGTYKLIATVDELEYVDEVEKANTTYYYKVKALFDITKTVKSAFSSVSSLKVNYAAVKLESVTVLDPSIISITYQADEYASNYLIYRATSSSGTYSKVGESESTTFIDDTVKVNATYYYKVAAVSENGLVSSYSNVLNAKTVLVTPKLNSVNVIDDTSFEIDFTAVDNAATYSVYRATSSSGKYSLIYTGSDTTVVDDTVAVNTSYYYKVTANSANGSSTGYSNIKNNKVTFAAPVIETIKATDNDEITLTFNKYQYCTSYNVYRATSKSGKYTLVANVEDTTYVDEVKVNTTYYYKVKGVNSQGYESGFSAIKSAKTTYSAVKLVSVKGTDTNEITLTFNASNFESEYIIYRSTSTKASSYQEIGRTDQLTYIDSEVDYKKTYYYKVVASRNGQQSSASNVLNTKTELKAVKLVSVKGTDTNEITLTFNASNFESEYIIYRSTSTKASSYQEIGRTDQLTYIDSEVDYKKTYYYKVVASRNDQQSSASNVLNTKTELKVGKISTIKAISPTEVELNFTAANFADCTYTIYRSTSKSGKYTAIGQTNDLSFVDDSALANKTYYYKITAEKDDNVSSYSSALSVSTKMTTVSSLKLTKKSASSILVTFKDNNFHQEYEIYRSTDKKNYEIVGTTEENSFLDETAQYNKTYYYKVVAVYDEVKTTSSVASVKLVVEQPVISKISTKSSTVTLTIKEVTMAYKYEIYQSNKSSGVYELIGETDQLTFVVDTIKGKKYYYKVKAICASNDEDVVSKFSAVKNITSK